jgi:hypothetical protein
MNYAHLVVIGPPFDRRASVRYYDGTYLGVIRPVHRFGSCCVNSSTQLIFEPAKNFDEMSLRAQIAVAQRVQELNNDAWGWFEIVIDSIFSTIPIWWGGTSDPPLPENLAVV